MEVKEGQSLYPAKLQLPSLKEENLPLTETQCLRPNRLFVNHSFYIPKIPQCSMTSTQLVHD
jgi:hypothetical protein